MKHKAGLEVFQQKAANNPANDPNAKEKLIVGLVKAANEICDSQVLSQ